ncbi:Phosphotransferase enzyme family protein [Caulifigura coniformis]|uniref:Phosphotransferase enzyme family protein n=1 Tax=Caulifigura coniformis TaxID=2527983 RepID=A0A517SHD0_9PLAN|nr:bifunctional aminoglycoside phosphotransferase/ATP-binding protein [Caulifigura coniformis]QDT55530.1 Phosphotransferase enzyme family protein [Caulifigura coniformis]
MPGPPSWLEALHRPDAYPHPTAAIRLVETHLSWVVLTGDWAYKLKKPIALGFVDFSTLDKRKACCEEELRLNRRTVPGIYDDVVTLVQTGSGPRFDKQGDVLEYAVRMHQFPQSDVLLSITDSGRLTPSQIEQLAHSIAAMHASAAVAPENSPFGKPATVRRYTEGCLPPVAAAISPDQAPKLDSLTRWVQEEATRLDQHFADRRQAGFIRECHGDLHLGNIVLVDGVPQPFDCIEFNAELRFIDVVSDLAFIFMDLVDHERPGSAWQLLNGWLTTTGDFSGLAALRYYVVYRALVRAKVAAIRLTQAGLTPNDIADTRKLLAGYLELADRQSRTTGHGLILMHGLSGSGKSCVARTLSLELGAVCIRSDVERKRNLASRATAGVSELYSGAAISDVYRRMLDPAAAILRAGLPVIVDATFLEMSHRLQFQRLADELGVPWALVTCEAPESVLEQRVQKRRSEGGDPSDATLEVLRLQRSSAAPLSATEIPRTHRCETSGAVDQVRLAAAVRSLLAFGATA